MILQLQKRTMAIAGLVMMAYLIFHMLSNLSFFAESTFSNFYHWYNGGLVRWFVLLLVTVAIIIHLKVAIKIRRVNTGRRIIDYKKHDKFKVPASLVTISISFLLGFIVVHTIQTLSFDTVNVYAELIQLFQSEWMLLFYLAGLFVLTMHLQHSLTNVLQTLGITSLTCYGLVLTATLLLSGGFASIPLYIYFVMP